MRWYEYIFFGIAFALVYRAGFRKGKKAPRDYEYKGTCTIPGCKFAVHATHHEVVLNLVEKHVRKHKEEL